MLPGCEPIRVRSNPAIRPVRSQVRPPAHPSSRSIQEIAQRKSTLYLDDLNNLVGDLQKRIPQHHELLSGNEWLTRYALIDPLLSALGWDLSDPSQIIPEYQSGAGRADYALLVGGSPPAVIIEAKRLGRNVLSGISQSINYCLTLGVRFFAVTDGDQWRVYETHKPVPLDQKLILEFSITGSSQQTTMTMLWFWRGNFIQDDPTEVVLPPKPQRETPKTIVPESNQERLSELSPRAREKAPQLLIFPDNSKKKLSSWRDLQLRVVEWLIETRRLTQLDCPLTTPRGTHYVHSRPERRDGSSFVYPVQVKGLWIEGSLSARDHIRVSQFILKHRGVDPTQIVVARTADAHQT